MTDKPFCQASENNKQSILTKLKFLLADLSLVVEVGAGTGQHASYFSSSLPHLIWCPTDLPDKLPGIVQWAEEASSDNLLPPLVFDVVKDEWPLVADAVFTANTTHIMPVLSAKVMMARIAEFLPIGGVFIQYGPFKIKGEYTTESNAQFDACLVEQGYGGMRDLAELQGWAGERLRLIEVYEMPANNFLLYWKKQY